MNYEKINFKIYSNMIGNKNTYFFKLILKFFL